MKKLFFIILISLLFLCTEAFANGRIYRESPISAYRFGYAPSADWLRGFGLSRSPHYVRNYRKRTFLNRGPTRRLVPVVTFIRTDGPDVAYLHSVRKARPTALQNRLRRVRRPANRGGKVIHIGGKAARSKGVRVFRGGGNKGRSRIISLAPR